MPLFFHITPRSNLQSISTTGLLPQLGDRARQLEHETAGVFLFTSRTACEDALSNWLGEEFDEDEDLLLLEVDVTAFAYDQVVDWEAIVRTPIPPSAIMSVVRI